MIVQYKQSLMCFYLKTSFNKSDKIYIDFY